MTKNVFNSYLNSHFKKLNDLSKKGFETSAKFYSSFYKNFLPQNRNAKILDIGCGTGQFLYFLEKRGYANYYGIDISKQQIQFCKEKITKKVETVDVFEFLKDKKNGFDVIVANDFLEHINKNQLMKLLGLIYTSLKNNGILMVKVPNMSNPFGLINRYMDITHEIGFTEFSLSQILEVVGFQEIQLKGASYPIISLKSVIGKIGEKIVCFLLKLLHLVQGNIVPKIMNNEIIAIAVKKREH